MSCSDACLKSHVAAPFELRSAAPVLSCCWHTFCKPDCVPQVWCSTTDQPHFHSALDNHGSPEAFKINLKGKRKVISESYLRREKITPLYCSSFVLLDAWLSAFCMALLHSGGDTLLILVMMVGTVTCMMSIYASILCFRHFTYPMSDL